MPTSLTAPVRLSTLEFHKSVHALAPRVAVFDCDGTLWAGDAGSTFMRWTMGELDAPPLLSPEKIAWMRSRYEAYKAGTVSELAICGEMVQVYADIPVETLRTAAAAFFRDHVEPHIFPEMLQLIGELQAKGCEIWAVSSTNDWVIEEGVRRFNIPASRVLAARVSSVDGLATGCLVDVPTDEGKVAALRRAGITRPDAVFGNSVHDAAMLSIAGSRHGIRGAFPVNPSAELLLRSVIEDWSVFFPSAVGR